MGCDSESKKDSPAFHRVQPLNWGPDALQPDKSANKHFILPEGTLSSHRAPVQNRSDRTGSLGTLYSGKK